MEEPELLSLWVNDHGDLPRLAKEVSMEKHIVRRQEDPHARMCVLPADNDFAGKPLLDVAAQMGPSTVRKRQGSRSRPRFLGWSKVPDCHKRTAVVMMTANQKTTQFT